jgi:hypothetical protein
LGGAALAVAGLAAAPILGPLALGAAAIGAVGSLGSWWAASRGPRGRKAAEERYRELEVALQAARLDRLERLAEDFTYYAVPGGANQARELANAWRTLRESVGGPGEVLADELLRVADEAYEEGARLLESALEARAALDSFDDRSLRRELDTWTRERERLDPAQAGGAERVAALDQRIAAHQRRLDLFAQQQAAIVSLLAEVEHLEAALHEAYLGQVAAGTKTALEQESRAPAELASAVEVARRVSARVEALPG